MGLVLATNPSTLTREAGGVMPTTVTQTRTVQTPAVTTSPRPSWRNQNEYNDASVIKLGLVIRTSGYACGQPEAAWDKGPGPYGKEIEVLCETGWFQVIQTPQGQFRAATWKTRLR